MAETRMPGMAACTVATSTDGPVGVITLGGSVGVESEALLAGAYREVSKGVKRVRWHFQPGTTINSAGIAVLITLTSQARAKRITVEVSGLSTHYKKIFEMIGLSEYVEIV